ncbi:hypothetical protein LY474_02220 [Myxococcus stipitatus]|uniref:hypothetical protein n=1 Tax=Myxococcus stipitatus TaxID=83455 RepID=UPI001F452CA8|nr:hypothetical protein [Myxococcus stipitatus]MCE9666616.1 hypothetical protein [Myxococcus stipitatus]
MSPWIALAAGLSLTQVSGQTTHPSPLDPNNRDPAATALRDATEQAAEEAEGAWLPPNYTLQGGEAAAPYAGGPYYNMLTPVLPNGEAPATSGDVAIEETYPVYSPIPSANAAREGQANEGATGGTGGSGGAGTSSQPLPTVAYPTSHSSPALATPGTGDETASGYTSGAARDPDVESAASGYPDATPGTSGTDDIRGQQQGPPTGATLPSTEAQTGTGGSGATPYGDGASAPTQSSSVSEPSGASDSSVQRQYGTGASGGTTPAQATPSSNPSGSGAGAQSGTGGAGATDQTGTGTTSGAANNGTGGSGAMDQTGTGTTSGAANNGTSGSATSGQNGTSAPNNGTGGSATSGQNGTSAPNNGTGGSATSGQDAASGSGTTPGGTPPPTNATATAGNPDVGFGGSEPTDANATQQQAEMERLRTQVQRMEEELKARDAQLDEYARSTQQQVDTFGTRAAETETARQGRLSDLQSAGEWMLAADAALQQGEDDIDNALDIADSAFANIRDSAAQYGQGTVIVHADRARALLNLARDAAGRSDGFAARLALQEAGYELAQARGANLGRSGTGNSLLTP